MAQKRTEVLKAKVRTFALNVVKLSCHLWKKRASILAAQFLRSGTSIPLDKLTSKMVSY